MIHLIKSQKDCFQVIYNDFIYEKKQILNNLQEWRCITKNCSAKATSGVDIRLELNSFKVVSGHNHFPQHKEPTKGLYIDKMKELIKKTNESTRSIVHIIIRGVSADIVKALSNFELVYRMLRYYMIK
ncbi:hypothetical protein TUBRATIS_11480 [Tubulinosema ratisbonensis]|uniref:FLYWCH-type domain-containing protein n=1 Tax=Tubulinosema ratisbonensis TaxID=291195 RepID=A0A437AMF1_9MICR|nr:hypothetical protein TUBRATIS_11480 [Tubulinosema ratisbonensis]